MLSVDGVCVFRGEEERLRNGITDMRDLCQELARKTPWIYGDNVNYVFGYVAGGAYLELRILFRNHAGKTGTSVLRHYKLSRNAERLALLLALLNIARLLPAIARACPPGAHREFEDVMGSGGVLVRVNPSCVEKCFLVNGPERIEHLRRIYDVLSANNVPNVVCLVKLKSRVAVFEPRGEKTRPATLSELFIAIRQILEALVVLHAASWMHRDIRWPNVMKHRDGSGWFLIDFDDAVENPQQHQTGRLLSKEQHTPELSSGDGSHTSAVDVWSVGYLIDRSRVSWSDRLCLSDFTTWLMNEDPSRRPTAAQALEKLLHLEQSESAKRAKKEEGARKKSKLGKDTD
ncbi:hypothetical protein Poli38472_012345 [Pythium oligandrum]|uniref:Protein kinase domain-containing protein n=1 Tax=Pythium oligandrum TaxID=41045 RepID=A0A8K1FNE2_PYTOL|nr:hypothetical protein Poli38472_012345 [Pythium oligandrum]|eukprot:TMW67229.1 hypothetical protein Poli38472_012345 [Pythium oligandrum]